VPRAGDAWRLPRAIMLGDASARIDFAGAARGELRAVLARDDDRGRRHAFEFLRIQMTPARDAVDVLRLVLVVGRGERLALAFGESLLPLSHRGARAFHAWGR